MIKDLYSGYIAGKAFNKFEKKEYEKAARLFEQVLGHELKGTNVKYVKSYLGRCYLGAGKVSDAVTTLLESLSKYKEAGLIFQSDYERLEYGRLLEALSAALLKAGREAEARTIADELKGLRGPRS